MLNEQQVEELAEQFENQWRANLSGPIALGRFLEEREIHAEQEPRLITILATIDIELAWQAWSKSLESLVTSHATDTIDQVDCERLLAQQQSLPRVDDYLTYLKTWSHSDPAWLQLLQCEAMARTHWGDNIGAAYYERRYGTSVKLSGNLPLRHMEVFKRGDSASHDASQAPRLRVELRGMVQVGRQRSLDPVSWGCTDDSAGTRVIIADRKDTRVSREQLSVYLLNPQFVVVRNGSKDCSDMSSQGDVILPGQCRLVSFPFIIKLIDNRLVFE